MRYNSARQMIFDAYRMTGDSVMAGAIDRARLGNVVQATQKQNNDWRIVHGLEAGAVISRVEALPVHLKAMALYCYGPLTREERGEYLDEIQVALYRELLADGIRLPGQGRGKPSQKQLNQFYWLCRAAAYHYAETTWPYSRSGLPTPKAVQRFMLEDYGVDVEVRDWARKDRSAWGGIWARILACLDTLDNRCLGVVAQLMYAEAA
ncbi:hypothetical protein [Halomonas sp. McH1-25]|uniref:hypothetical protein n=2 Tax=Halomonas TaxID=2745 RepID=UPI001EF7116E|nr:hypothetical protein [Halomonas sp. McH1-25]